MLSGESSSESIEENGLNDFHLSMETKMNILEYQRAYKPFSEIEERMDQILWSFSLPIFSKTVDRKDSTDRAYEYVFKMANFMDYFHFLSKMRIRFKKFVPVEMEFSTFMCKKDFNPLTCKDQNVQHLIAKHLLKVNNILKYGSFSVDPSGCIYFKVMGNYDISGKYVFQDDETLEKWFRVNFATTITTLKGNITRILRIADIINEQQYKEATQAQPQIRKLPPFFDEHQLKIAEKIESFIRGDNEVGGTLSTLSTASSTTSANYSKVSKERREMAKKTIAPYSTPFYQKFEVFSIIFVGKLSQGGYADILILKADVNQPDVGRINNKYILAKVPRKDSSKIVSNAEIRNLPDDKYLDKLAFARDTTTLGIDDNRIKNEREILSYPQEKNFQFIARYYDDIKMNPVLYIEHYMPLNLYHYSTKKLVSLQTIWYWMFQLGHFLRFTKENNIIHLDFKPENVVIAKNYFLKVIDFAESIIKGKSNLSTMTRGHTLPFTAPEVLTDLNNTTTQSDVFAYSHIIYSLITGKKLVGYKRNSNLKLSAKYKDRSYKTLPFKNSFKDLGPKFFMKYVFFTIMAGLSPKPDARPEPENLILIFYEMMNFSEKLF